MQTIHHRYRSRRSPSLAISANTFSRKWLRTYFLMLTFGRFGNVPNLIPGPTMPNTGFELLGRVDKKDSTYQPVKRGIIALRFRTMDARSSAVRFDGYATGTHFEQSSSADRGRDPIVIQPRVSQPATINFRALDNVHKSETKLCTLQFIG